MKLNPIFSVLKTLLNSIQGQIHFPNSFNGMKVKMEDNQEFEIFRHVVIGDKGDTPENGAVFIVRFKLSNMSIEENKRFSRLPIPMFIGLPGFKAKFWMCDERSGYNQGIYQWQSYRDAVNYSNSFAMNFMSKRSEKGSVSYYVLDNCNIFKLINNIKKP